MNLDLVDSLGALSRALRERRVEAGITPVELSNSVHQTRDSIASSTVYKVESGNERFTLRTMRAYLRGCGADDAEIGTWHTPYERAMATSEVRGSRDQEQVVVPTAKQLAEMGTEEAARLFGRIDVAEAADLLRRIEMKQAVALLPEISPDVAVTLLSRTSRARRALLFEQIASQRGAELLAEMPMEVAKELLDELVGKRASELLAAMPRGRAARLLDMSDVLRAVRLLANMQASDAALLLGELDRELAVEVLCTAPPSKAAQVLGVMDRDVAVQLIVDRIPHERVGQLLSADPVHVASRVIDSVPPAVARRFMAELSIGAVTGLFTSLDFARQSELLDELLAPEAAAAVLETVDLGENFGFIVDNIHPARLAEIVPVMEPHRGILTLVCARTACDVVLTLLPVRDAERIRAELEPEKLATHLASVDPYWAVRYLAAMGARAEEVLAVTDAATVARIVKGASTFEETAALLESVRVEHIAGALLPMSVWEAARVLTLMSSDRAATALAAMPPERSRRIVTRIFEDTEKRDFSDGQLTAEKFAEVVASRRKAAQLLRDAVDNLRASRPNDPE